MKILLTLFVLLFSSFVNAKEFKSSHGFSFILDDTYEHIMEANFSEMETMIKAMTEIIDDENFNDFANSFSSYENIIKNNKIEFLYDFERYTFFDSINIMQFEVESFFKKDLKDINFVEICELTTEGTNKKFNVNQTIYACVPLDIPKNAKWSFAREVSGINFGRTIQVQFEYNEKQTAITITCLEENCDNMRQDLSKILTTMTFN